MYLTHKLNCVSGTYMKCRHRWWDLSVCRTHEGRFENVEFKAWLGRTMSSTSILGWNLSMICKE